MRKCEQLVDIAVFQWIEPSQPLAYLAGLDELTVSKGDVANPVECHRICGSEHERALPMGLSSLEVAFPCMESGNYCLCESAGIAELNRPQGRLHRQRFQTSVSPEGRERRVGVREACMHPRRIRLPAKSSLEELDSSDGVVFRKTVRSLESAQECVIGTKARFRLSGPADLGSSNLADQRPSDPLCHLVLHGKEVIDASIISLSPDVIAG